MVGDFLVQELYLKEKWIEIKVYTNTVDGKSNNWRCR
jgi:hypothetical protein